MTRARSIPGRIWTALVLLTFASILLLASGTTDDGVRAPGLAAARLHSEVASAAVGSEVISLLSPSSDSSFPILPLAGGAFIAMTIALHLAARRFAH